MHCPTCQHAMTENTETGAYPRWNCATCALGFQPGVQVAAKVGAADCPGCGSDLQRHYDADNTGEFQRCDYCAGTLASLDWFAAKADARGPGGTHFRPLTIAGEQAQPQPSLTDRVAAWWRNVRRPTVTTVRSPNLEFGGTRFSLSAKKALLGRSPNADLRVDEASVSREHALVQQHAPGVWSVRAHPAASTPLRLNGRKIQHAYLKPADVLQLGNSSANKVVFSAIAEGKQRAIRLEKLMVNAPTIANPQIQVLSGEAQGNVFLLMSPRLLIGRSQRCALILPDATVSDMHANLVNENNTWRLVAIIPTNPVTVNQQKIRQVYLQPNDVVSIGGVKLRFDGDSTGEVPMPALPD